MTYNDRQARAPGGHFDWWTLSHCSIRAKKSATASFTVADFFIKLTLSLCSGNFPSSAPLSFSAGLR